MADIDDNVVPVVQSGLSGSKLAETIDFEKREQLFFRPPFFF